MENGKVSIVIPCYGTELYVGRCLDSLINQTYKNIEIVVVNDASPNNMESILKKYEKKDNRIKVITHRSNKGLFHARLTGADGSTGDYICFVDSDDYVSVDYIRNLVFDIEKRDADMVFCNTILEEFDGRYIYNLFDFHIDVINNDDCLKYYFDQKGFCYRWHTIWNKLYRMTIWKKARKYYDAINSHLIMTEDFAFSTVLFYFCKKIVFNEYANYFYCSNDDASTSLASPNFKKFNKNIDDVFVSFNFVEKFMKKVKIYEKYKNDYLDWYNLYLKIWYDNIANSTLDDDDKEKLFNKLLDKKSDIDVYKYSNELNFYNSKTKFNDQYEKIVTEIVNDEHKVISFDIFDTLIVRPFFEPKDLFKLLNKKYRELVQNSSIVFSEIREQAEKLCRDHVYRQSYYEEVTLDEIYEYIYNNFLIEESVLKKLKKYEITLELKFCSFRKSGKNLYELAKYLGKRVVAVSDIYLPRIAIEEILKVNNYQDLDRIYLSCEERLSKATGQLYKIVVTQENVLSEEILHIGDNVLSDYENARSIGICTCHLPKAIDMAGKYFNRIFLKSTYNIDNSNYLSFSGVRISLALVANKFFDNPYISFEDNSEFNSNPAFVGYFALGMHTFALTKWLFDDIKKKEYDSVTFMARDGYLIKKEFDLLIKMRNSDILSSYLPISRKSLIPYSFEKKEDFVKLLDYFPYDTISPYDIVYILDEILVDSIKTDNYSKKKFNTYDDFSKFLIFDVIVNIDEKKLIACRKKLKDYFLKFYHGKSANFDIGYSAKPENTLTRLLGKKIDTYFVHFNDNNGYYYSNDASFDLNVFYDYKPKFTGMLREYMFSELVGSCKKYDCCNEEVSIIYDDINIDYYEKWILDIIQEYCLRFTSEVLDYFGDDIDELFFPKYYMSVPYEYFLHNASFFDRKIFCNLMFENTINDDVNIETLWKDIVEYNNKDINLSTPMMYDTIVNNFYQLNVKKRNKFIKLLYYSFFDRVTLRAKVKKRFKANTFVGKFLRRVYHFIRK